MGRSFRSLFGGSKTVNERVDFKEEGDFYRVLYNSIAAAKLFRFQEWFSAAAAVLFSGVELVAATVLLARGPQTGIPDFV